MTLLTKSELDIMFCLWDTASPVTSREIQGCLTNRNWKQQTIVSAIKSLEDEGYVLCDRQTRKNLYSPIISQRQYMVIACTAMQESRNLKVEDIIADLFHSNKLSAGELNDIRHRIDELLLEIQA